MFKDLYDQINEKFRETTNGWITPQGFTQTFSGDHSLDAADRLEKLTGQKHNAWTAIRDLQKLTGNIRYALYIWKKAGTEFIVDVAGPITSLQVNKIGRMAKPFDYLYYTIYNPATKKKYTGDTWRKFVRDVPKALQA